MSRLLAAGIAAIALCSAAPASAESVVNISGTISSGTDTGGLFGGGSLVGQTFTARVVMHDDGVFGDQEPGSSSALMSQRASIHFAINGFGYGLTTPAELSGFFARSDTGWGSQSSYTLTSGGSYAGNSASVTADAYSPLAGLIPWDIFGLYDFTTGPGDVTTFKGSVGRDGVTTSFIADGGPLRVWSGGTSAVPEPATWAMMTIGFAGAGALLRRSRARSKSPVGAVIPA